MIHFIYNDTAYTVTSTGAAWDLTRTDAGGRVATVGTGLFAGVPASEVAARARALVQTLNPVGVRLVGPDVAHPLTVGDLRIVGPNVGHPNFVHWDQDSSSFPS